MWHPEQWFVGALVAAWIVVLVWDVRTRTWSRRLWRARASFKSRWVSEPRETLEPPITPPPRIYRDGHLLTPQEVSAQLARDAAAGATHVVDAQSDEEAARMMIWLSKF